MIQFVQDDGIVSLRDVDIDIPSAEFDAWLGHFVMPLAVRKSPDDHPQATGPRGTFTLLDAGERHVFVTCYHVWESLERLRKEEREAEIHAYVPTIDNQTIRLNGFTLLDKEKSLDVAIFKGLEDRASLPLKEFFNYQANGPIELHEGEIVHVAGYPSENIKQSPGVTITGRCQAHLSISSFSDRQIVLANTHSRVFVDFYEPGKTSLDVGGMSGGIAVSVNQNNRAQFLGVIKEGANIENTLFISRLQYLKPDGTLDHQAISW